MSFPKYNFISKKKNIFEKKSKNDIIKSYIDINDIPNGLININLKTYIKEYYFN